MRFRDYLDQLHAWDSSLLGSSREKVIDGYGKGGTCTLSKDDNRLSRDPMPCHGKLAQARLQL